MSYLSNVHTHTTFCDGSNTPEEMVKRAIELNYESLGFSAHAYSPDGDEWCLLPQRELEYRDEILRLKELYSNKIQIYLGIEQDMFSHKIAFEPEYVIGSLHYIYIDGVYHSVDTSEEIAKDTVKECFDGDWIKYAIAYYEQASKNAEITKCDIVGHFDLVTKFNEGYKHFDETDRRYRAAATEALRYEAKHCNLFEVNTGAIARKKRSAPYPADFLLKELKDLNCDIILTSDSHSVEGLGCAFDMATDYAKSCGFKYAKILRNNKFEDIKL